jgi:hypothetical protein
VQKKLKRACFAGMAKVLLVSQRKMTVCVLHVQ